MALPKVLTYKCRAAAFSLAIFLVFATVLALLATRFWYPDYLFRLDGGLQGLRIVLLVDLVMGPVLALVFFHPEKSRGKLVFDIVVVSLLQVGAMAWGSWMVWSQRPVAVVYGNQRFISVAPDIMRRQGETAATLARFSDAAPPYIYRRAPANVLEQKQQLLMLIRYGFHPEAQAFLFTSFRKSLDQVFERQAALRKWLRTERAPAWQAWVKGRAEADPARYRFAFYEGRYGNALLVFNQAGEYLGYLDMDLADELLPVFEEEAATPAAKPGAAGPEDGAPASKAAPGKEAALQAVPADRQGVR